MNDTYNAKITCVCFTIAKLKIYTRFKLPWQQNHFIVRDVTSKLQIQTKVSLFRKTMYVR